MTYDRRTQDVGNILAMEHFNVTVPDQELATLFYVSTLGFTRDPYMDFGARNVWVNIGNQQVHLPKAAPQVLRGRVGIVMPDLDALARRLTARAHLFEGTEFSWEARSRWIDVTCPWGNRLRIRAPSANDSMVLGIDYVEFDVGRGTATAIGNFYRQVFSVRTATATTRGSRVCTVFIGTDQELRFRERARSPSPYDGHHIAVYLVDFSRPYRELRKRRLVTVESSDHEYRFDTIIDLRNGRPLFEIEHEVRSLHHPMFNRDLANRNPVQSFGNYRRGQDRLLV